MSTPTFLEVLRKFVDARLADVNVAIPGKVVSYDASKTSVDVQPLIKRGYENEEGARAVESLPIVPGVPVVFPGAGAYRITFPIAVGDTVLLVFSQASLDVWLSEGGEVDPLDERRHTLSDAIAIPGLRDFKSTSSAGTSALALEAPEVRLGSHDASKKVATEDDLGDIWYALQNASVNPTDGGALLLSSIIALLASRGWPSGYGSSKVKADT